MTLSRDVITTAQDDIKVAASTNDFDTIKNILNRFTPPEAKMILEDERTTTVRHGRSDVEIKTPFYQLITGQSKTLEGKAEFSFNLLACFIGKGLSNLNIFLTALKFGFENNPKLLLRCILDGMWSAEFIFGAFFIHAEGLKNNKELHDSGIMKEILLSLLAKKVNYLNSSMAERDKITGTTHYHHPVLIDEIAKLILHHPLGTLSLLIYHESILRGDLAVFNFYQKQGIKISYDAAIISELLNARQLTRGEFARIRNTLNQLKNYDQFKAEDINDAINQLCKLQPTYSYDFDYPVVIRKFKEKNPNPPANQGIAQLVPALYMELGMEKELFNDFFLPENNKWINQIKGENNPPARRSKPVLEQPAACIDSLKLLIKPHIRNNVIAVFQSKLSQSDVDQDDLLNTLCAIALHPDLPPELKQPLIYIIDRITSPDYAQLSVEHNKTVSNKPLKQTDLLSFFGTERRTAEAAPSPSPSFFSI